MGNLISNTASNRPDVTPETIDELEEIIDEYDFIGTFDTLDVYVHDGIYEYTENTDPHLRISGQAAFDASKPIEDTDGSVVDREQGFTEEFLERIAPHLKEQLVVRTIGREKMNFNSFYATQWCVWPDGTTHYDTLERYPDKPTTDE